MKLAIVALEFAAVNATFLPSFDVLDRTLKRQDTFCRGIIPHCCINIVGVVGFSGKSATECIRMCSLLNLRLRLIYNPGYTGTVSTADAFIDSCLRTFRGGQTALCCNKYIEVARTSSFCDFV
jgi:hypothetical protein